MTPEHLPDSTISGRVLADPIARSWMVAYDAAPAACRWEVAHVDERLVDAITLCARVAGPVGPRSMTRAWPAIARIYERLNEFDQTEIDSLPADEDEPPSPPRITARQVSDMEDALDWPGRYIIGHFSQRQILALWLRCKANRKSFRKALKHAGYVEGTSKRRRWQASLLIATGLIRDGIEAPAPSAVHPFEPVTFCAAPKPVVMTPLSLDRFWSEVELVVAVTDPEQLPTIIEGLILTQAQSEFSTMARKPRTLIAMQKRIDALKADVTVRFPGFCDFETQ